MPLHYAPLFHPLSGQWVLGAIVDHVARGLTMDEVERAATKLNDPGQWVNRPGIICLCGSTRFRAEFQAVNKQLTLAGFIVLSVGYFSHAEAFDTRMMYGGADDAGMVSRTAGDKELTLGKEVAERIDTLHLRKIELADSIYVINVHGYIGTSTRREIEHATSLGKPVRYHVDPWWTSFLLRLHEARSQ